MDEKLICSKNVINSTWSGFIKNQDIVHSNKLKIYEAASRSVMCYASQVWGYRQYEQVEKLLRFFIKKMLYLPTNTPNYMLHIETGLDRLFLYTLKIHFDYIRSILQLPRNRLPRLLVEETIMEGTFWAKDWYKIFNDADINLNFFDQNINWNEIHTQIIKSLKKKHWDEHINQASTSQFHDEYHNLKYSNVPRYFDDRNSVNMVSLICKTRGGLLNINARAFKMNTNGICTICNLDESENTFHFIARCPIYKQARKKYFGKVELTKEEFYARINGQDYESLYKYLSYSIEYRKHIVNEFN